MIKNNPYIDDKKPIVYLVASPIGNIDDITLRALKVLKEADIIACEDTRNTSLLLKRLGIEHKKLYSLYAQTEKKDSIRLLEKIKNDKEILCYLSDAGMPGISDPGTVLVSEAYKMDIKVSVLPGACAFISALVISNLKSDDFTFYGFLPSKISNKKKILEEIKNKRETSIFYESPMRINETLEVLKDISLKNREISIVRELTKIHEEVVNGTVEEVLNSKLEFKGEIVLLINGCKEEEIMEEDKVIELLKEGLKKDKISSIAKDIAKISNRSKKEIYELALKIQNKD